MLICVQLWLIFKGLRAAHLWWWIDRAARHCWLVTVTVTVLTVTLTSIS